MSLLIQNNHTQAHLYGLTFFKTALTQIHQQKQNDMKNISIALRVARFADDEEFKEFAFSDDKDEVIEDDELVCF